MEFQKGKNMTHIKMWKFFILILEFLDFLLIFFVPVFTMCVKMENFVVYDGKNSGDVGFL